MGDTSPFDRVGHESISEAVVDQIEQMIVDGILKEGRKLPSERELAEAMGVSRPKLREALQVLEDRGLVHVRHGEGTYIATISSTVANKKPLQAASPPSGQLNLTRSVWPIF